MTFKSLVQFFAKTQSLIFEKFQFKKWTVGIFVKCRYSQSHHLHIILTFLYQKKLLFHIKYISGKIINILIVIFPDNHMFWHLGKFALSNPPPLVGIPYFKYISANKSCMVLTRAGHSLYLPGGTLTSTWQAHMSVPAQGSNARPPD